MKKEEWKKRAGKLKRETYTLYLASRHPRVPWYTKLLTILIVLYAISPLDLIPDFVPVLGYLDDIIIIAAGFSLVIRLTPKDVLAECRERAGAEVLQNQTARKLAVVLVVALWLVGAAIAAKLAVSIFF